MYSIGRMISNFRDFYNDINAATLTGAIDVVVVEQPDGEFTCSPFHVRFGKLGVLRSKEKLVDIEINGEIRDIHMKLGESGEAFFVEGVYEEDEAVPENLATSPITVTDFPPLFDGENQIVCPRPRRNSADIASEFLDENPLNQTSDYAQRRYTDGGEAEKRRERQLQEQQQQQYVQDCLQQEQHAKNHINGEVSSTQVEMFAMDDDIKSEEKQEQCAIISSTSSPNMVGNNVLPKTFRAATIRDVDMENCKKFPSSSDFRPIDDTTGSAITLPLTLDNKSPNKPTDPKEDAGPANDDNGNGKGANSGGKKKRRKRSLMKKKNSQRKNSNSSSACSVQSELELDAQSDSMFFRDAKLAAENSVMSQSMGSESCDTINRMRDPDIHFFSDTEVSSAQSPRGSRPCTPVQSDTEFEMSQRQFQANDNDNSGNADNSQHQSWRWGELPSPPPKISNQQSPSESTTPDEEKKKLDEAKQAERNSMLSGMFSFMKQTKRLRAKKAPVEGLYLADISAEDMDPEVAALYFPRTQVKKEDGVEDEQEEDYESGNGPSLTQSPSSLEGACGGSKSMDSDFDEGKNLDNRMNEEVMISLCGGLDDNGPSDEQFQRHVVPYSEVCRDPYVLENPNVVVRLGGKYYNWKTACPIVMTLIVYQQPLPQTAIERLCSDQIRMNTDNISNKTSSSNDSPKDVGKSYWWYWRRSSDKTQPKALDDAASKAVITIEAGAVAQETPGAIVQEAVQSNQIACSISIDIPGAQDSSVATQTTYTESEAATATSSEHKEDGYSGSQSSEESDPDTQRSGQQPAVSSSRPLPEKYRKTLRLSSEQIQGLNLNEGMNEVVFSVTTAYQGTSRCKCYMYRWRYDDKVVISDIDGTITKSDVLGHILPIVGKDWAQSGVAQLFTKIKNNGYKLLYLSSRAIGQAKGTREYLKSIKQNDLSLPDGPLLLNPTSLISAFHREVIEKKPEQFKISCLNDILSLFPADTKPFYAGYGNRINDVWAYRAVGIPIMRIFTINHRGELKHELTQTFQSSYSNMSFIVDQLFPPLLEDASEFSHFIYWRDPLPEVPVLPGDTAGNNNGAPSSSKGSSRGQSPLPTIPENSISH